MRADYVVDASVVGAAFFNEERSAKARELLASARTLVAPDLLALELASIAAKKVWRGEATRQAASRAIRALPEFVSSLAAGSELAEGAFALAAEHKFSVYDSAYLALAQQRQCPLLTYDLRLTERAASAGLGALVADEPRG